MDYLSIFILLCIICAILQYAIRSSNDDSSGVLSISSQSSQTIDSFKSFQYKYLLIYLLAMAADWLQGPYVYALYESYGFEKSDIAFLFVSGFLSSMCFGVIVGPIADKYGRRLMSIIFGILYSMSCLTKLVNDFGILLVGRVLGGISTSLLFSVFESWMVAEHNARDYPESWLGSTFYIATFLNGIVAIFAGLWSSFSADRWGFVSPFMWALGLLVICTVLIITNWSENYGNSSASLESTFRSSLQYLLNDRSIIKLGFIQSFFEASMYTFVFMWTPTLQESGSQVGDLPFGLIFATFMVCIMIGSSIFNIASKQQSMTTERLACYVFGCSVICMSVPYLLPTQTLLIYISFLMFEICCGMYFPTIGTLRSKYIPESARTSIMNYFRVPLNFMVVVVLSNISSISTTNIFLVCIVWLGAALFLQSTFASRQSPNTLPTSNTSH